MSKWKLSLYLSALFLAGVVTGAFVTVTVGRQMMSPNKMASHWRSELETKLQLTPEQVRQIDPILKDSMTQFRTILAGQMLISMTNCNARIRTILKPDQQAKFNDVERHQIEFVSGAFKNEKRPEEK